VLFRSLITMKVLLLFAFVCFALSCMPGKITVKKVSNPLGPKRGWNPKRYSAADVQEDIESSKIKFVPVDSVSLSCVDSRETHGVAGTPGGDIGEFVIAAQTYVNYIKRNLADDEIKELLKKFIFYVASPERPFYYHTAKHYIGHWAEHMGHVVMPTETPHHHLDHWLDEFVKVAHQGCGHLKAQIKNPSDFGLTDKLFIPKILKAFIQIWWEMTEDEKRLVNFDVLQGDLEAGAIAVLTEKGNQCPNMAPVIHPNAWGGSVFVANPQVIGYFRKNVVPQFFKQEWDNSINVSTFARQLEALGQKQLNQIIKVLAPANQVNIYSVEVEGLNSEKDE